MKKQTNQLRAGILLSYVNLALSSLIPMFYTPVMLQILGQAEHGLYSLANSTVSYLSLLNFGFGGAIIRYISKYRAENDREAIRRTYGFFLLLYSGLAVLVMVGGIVLTHFSPLLFDRSLTAAELKVIRTLIPILSVHTALTFPFSVFTSVILSHERYLYRRIMDIAATLITPVFNLIALYLGYASIGLAVTSSLVQIVLFLPNVVYSIRVLGLTPSFERIPGSLIREMVGFSGYVFLGSIVDMLFWATDKVILGMLVGSAAVSIYQIGSTFNTMVMQFSSAFSNVLAPRITGMVFKDASSQQLSELFIRVGRIQYLVIALVMSGFAAFGQTFIELWAGPGYKDSYWITVLTLFPLCIPLIQNTGLQILMAQNKHRFRSIVYLIIAIANVISTWLIVPCMGGIGAALCSCISYLLGQGIVINLYYYKVIRLDIPGFWKQILKMSMGCYIRLSHADETNHDDQHESNSIRNQRELIHHYLADHPEFSDWVILEFVDDGYSGTTENRPEFQRLLTLVHLGEIHGIIVKDLSRFARNYITMGNYLEQVFPLLGVRFISINDGYDSISANTAFDSMSVTLKAILHSYYSRDLSAKIFSCNTQRMKNGQFAGSPCFGYVMSSDKTHFEIDPEAAKIVRLIFDMALAGKTRPEIVKYLNDHNIPTPADYRQKQGRGKGNMITPNPLWDHVKVSKLLRQEAYTGKLIMRKHVQPVPCVKKYRKTSPDEQFVRENAHEPIVSREEFDKVQALMPRRKGWDRKNQREYPLKGLVRCGTCGKLMCVADTPAPGGFICKESRIEHSICSPKVHPMADIEQTVYQKIMLQQRSLLQPGHARRGPNHDTQTTAVQTQLQILYRQQSQLQQEKARNYETYISGDLTPEEYVILKNENTQQMLELQNNISILESQLASQPVQPLASNYVQATRKANQYCKSTELSRDMAASFVDRILLFEDHIDIQWKFAWLAEEGDQNGQKKSE